MNQVNETSQSRLLKTLAVFGFVAIIIIGTWLAVQVVRLAPVAFSSLASLAESVETGREAQNHITIASQSGVINSGTASTIEWSDTMRDGTYTFTYVCTEGVSLTVRTDTVVTDLKCDTPFALPTDTFTFDIQFNSEKNRFTDVPYEVAFIPAGEESVLLHTTEVATVVNVNIPLGGIVNNTIDVAVGTDDDTSTDDTTTDDTTDVVAAVEPEVTTPTTVTPNTQPTGTRYIYTTSYHKPVSDPKGTIELAIKYLGVGILTNDNKFIPKADIDTDDKAAYQFEVKNIGTKTSKTWEFEATLTSGEVYESKDQKALKPNERSVITLAFDNPGKEGFQTFGAEISGGGDKKSSNNSFSWGVDITD